MTVENFATFEGAVLGRKVCEGKARITQADIDAFCDLFGYDDPVYKENAPGGAIAPPSMGLTYGLRLGWESGIFPPGSIRVGDENFFGLPARAGEELTTVLTVVDRFERKSRRFLKYEMVTRNKAGGLVCSVTFTAIVP